MKLIRTTALFALIAGAAIAEDYSAGDLTIHDPFAYETAPTAMAGGGYLTITNDGPQADRLLEVRAAYPRVELHRSVEEGGVATMRPVEALEIPAGETVTLEPGGLHVMFMGLRDAPFSAGDGIPATLVFERAGEVEVVLRVEARDSSAEPGQGHNSD